jgi:hypothetical protein
MTASKLPEWPEEPGLCGTSHDWLNYHALVSYAALARMEALAAEVEQLRDEFLLGNPRHAEWLEIINALLAACERNGGEG